jgi:hypothetical protein
MRNPCQASELAPDERVVLERILGRQLRDSELVGVTTGEIVQPALEGAELEEAWKRMLEGMREMQEHFAGVPEEELNALIDEAIDYVRHNPE